MSYMDLWLFPDVTDNYITSYILGSIIVFKLVYCFVSNNGGWICFHGP